MRGTAEHVFLCLALLCAGPAAPQNKLQQAVDRSMAGRTGAAVVADVVSGRLLARHRIDIAAGRVATPGSAAKPFTLLALIDAGRGGARELCGRHLRIGQRRLDCTHAPTAQALDAASALAYSCNWYFARMALELTPDALAQAFRRAGLASLTGLAEREARGWIGTASNHDELRLQALGEEKVAVTPLGLLSAYRRLALARRRNEPSMAPVFEGLEGAVEYGSAQPARVAGLKVAGKTGTSRGPGDQWTHAWFAGYAPAARPEIVLVVFIEGGQGGPDAASVAGNIFAAYQRSTAR
jgi:peptidoglycan glycosyltransferase